MGGGRARWTVLAKVTVYTFNFAFHRGGRSCQLSYHGMVWHARASRLLKQRARRAHSKLHCFDPRLP